MDKLMLGTDIKLNGLVKEMGKDFTRFETDWSLGEKIMKGYKHKRNEKFPLMVIMIPGGKFSST